MNTSSLGKYNNKSNNIDKIQHFRRSSKIVTIVDARLRLGQRRRGSKIVEIWIILIFLRKYQKKIVNHVRGVDDRKRSLKIRWFKLNRWSSTILRRFLDDRKQLDVRWELKMFEKVSDRRRSSTKRFSFKKSTIMSIESARRRSVDESRRSSKQKINRRRFVDAPSTIVCSDAFSDVCSDVSSTPRRRFLIIAETSTKRRHYGRYRRACNRYSCRLM